MRFSDAYSLCTFCVFFYILDVSENLGKRFKRIKVYKYSIIYNFFVNFVHTTAFVTLSSRNKKCIHLTS